MFYSQRPADTRQGSTQQSQGTSCGRVGSFGTWKGDSFCHYREQNAEGHPASRKGLWTAVRRPVTLQTRTVGPWVGCKDRGVRNSPNLTVC